MPDCGKCANEPVWFCANCGKNLWQYNPDWPAIEPHVAYNTLHIKLEGGYGWFFDTDFTTHPDVYGVYICHECAHEMCDRYPWMKALLRDGHFHGFTYDENGDVNGSITDFDGPPMEDE